MTWNSINCGLRPSCPQIVGLSRVRRHNRQARRGCSADIKAVRRLSATGANEILRRLDFATSGCHPFLETVGVHHAAYYGSTRIEGPDGQVMLPARRSGQTRRIPPGTWRWQAVDTLKGVHPSTGTTSRSSSKKFLNGGPARGPARPAPTRTTTNANLSSVFTTQLLGRRSGWAIPSPAGTDQIAEQSRRSRRWASSRNVHGGKPPVYRIWEEFHRQGPARGCPQGDWAKPGGQAPPRPPQQRLYLPGKRVASTRGATVVVQPRRSDPPRTPTASPVQRPVGRRRRPSSPK